MSQTSYVKCSMPNAICQMLYVKLHLSNCYMSNAMTIAMSFSMTIEDIHYIYIHYSAMIFDIAITEKRPLLYYYGFTLYLKSPFILVHRHIMASYNISNHRLFRFSNIMALISISNHHLLRYANISRHYMITLIIVNSGSFIYRDISISKLTTIVTLHISGLTDYPCVHTNMIYHLTY
jgi:hypothetical protein